MVKIQTEVDGYRGMEGKGIHRNWMSRAIISISVITVRTVFQTGLWFFYKRSRLVSGSAISVPDRQLSGSGGNQALDSILVFFLAFQFFTRIPKGMGVDRREVVGSLSFDVQGWGVSANQDPFRQTVKGRGCVQKQDIFLGCHKCMVPKEGSSGVIG